MLRFMARTLGQARPPRGEVLSNSQRVTPAPSASPLSNRTTNVAIRRKTAATHRAFTNGGDRSQREGLWSNLQVLRALKNNLPVTLRPPEQFPAAFHAA